MVGVVDGAWWPHTDDLAAELPDLLAVLSVRLGPIDRVLYNLGEWPKAPTRLAVGQRSVHLDGYWHQPADSIHVVGLNRGAIALLVVAPDTNPGRAHATMMAAAGRNNVSAIEQLLQRYPCGAIDPGVATAAEQADWETEGGAVRDRVMPT